jgi:hypothetical protein
MSAVHPLLVGLVDSRTPSPPSRLLFTKELEQALHNVTSVLPYEDVRDKEWFLLHSRHTLNHDGRIWLIRFLWGKRIDPPTIRLVLLPLVKVQSEKDIDGILGSLACSTYDNRWWYFSTRYQINLFLNGRVKDPLNDYTRWKIALLTCGFGGRRWPTRMEIEHFFAEYGRQASDHRAPQAVLRHDPLGPSPPPPERDAGTEAGLARMVVGAGRSRLCQPARQSCARTCVRARLLAVGIPRSCRGVERDVPVKKEKKGEWEKTEGGVGENRRGSEERFSKGREARYGEEENRRLSDSRFSTCAVSNCLFLLRQRLSRSACRRSPVNG